MNIQWQHCYGGSKNNSIHCIIEIDDGYIFTGGTHSMEIPGYHYEGESDVWVVRIDLDGNIIWQRAYGGWRYEVAHNIIATADGGFIVVGNTQSKHGDVSGNHSTTEHNPDIWVFKINSDGVLQWQQCFGGSVNERCDYGVVKKSDNNFVIAGTTNYGPSHDVECTPRSSYTFPNTDIWVFEIMMGDTLNAISTPANTREIKIYPNPARDYIEFNIQNIIFKTADLIIFDIFGRYVVNKEITTPYARIDISKLPAGIYFYRLIIDEDILSGKFVISDL